MSNDALRVTNEIVIPASQLEWSFDPAGGPGGQHANRASTRAELRFDLGTSPSVPDGVRQRMLRRLGSRAPGGVVTVSVDESRSQWRNRSIARRRLASLLREALRTPRRRIPTKPGRAARRRRLDQKRRRSEKKRLRRPPEAE
jgi:ribosome-associated protein